MFNKALVSSLVAALGAAAFPAPACAQEIAASEWSISVGADPTAPKGSSVLSENFIASLTREWSRANSGVGFRTQLSAGALASTRASFNSTECLACSVVRKQRYAELAATATYTFRRKASLRPYLLAGPALYMVRSHYEPNGVVLAPPSAESTSWSLGATAGLGLGFTAFGKKFFIEQRMLVPQPSTDARGSQRAYPVVLGIRF